MDIDLRSESVIPARDVPKLLGPIGRRGSLMHISQVIRAITHGLNGHRLEAWRCGNSWLTSVEAVQRWLCAQTESAVEPQAPTPPAASGGQRSQAAGRKANEQAASELARALYPEPKRRGRKVRKAAAV
jgi:hypothetical protein